MKIREIKLSNQLKITFPKAKAPNLMLEAILIWLVMTKEEILVVLVENII